MGANTKLDFGSVKMFVSYLKSKKDAIKEAIIFIGEIKTRHKKSPKNIRMENLGENNNFSKMMKKIDPSTLIQKIKDFDIEMSDKIRIAKDAGIVDVDFEGPNNFKLKFNAVMNEYIYGETNEERELY